MAGVDDRPGSLQPLLDAAAAACDRGDWSSAVAIAEAAAALEPEDPAVVAMLARANTGTGSGTRRRLTVMFCDLVGSTEIASTLDPEDTRELLHAYYNACVEIVRRHDGHIAQFLGDGVLIYFGYPRAHEDDGLRAVLTGLAIIDAVGDLRAPAVDAGVALNVRIGIHTGLAVTSGLDGNAWTKAGDIFGETPNLAARVQAAAPTGSVVVSADTLRLVRDHVDAHPLGPHSLKGIDRPVELFHVRSVRSDDDRADDASRAVTVGRAAERAQLERAWLDASERSSYVVITGEPGIGKSHLVRHARGLVPEGGRSLVFRCSALHTNTPLHPVAQLLRSARAPDAGEHDDPLARLARLTERVGEASDENLYLLARICSVPWPAGRAVPDLPPEQTRERTLALLCAWIAALAAEGPLLFVVEDLHWADPSTLDLLRRCVAEPSEQPILVLVTTRLDADTVPGEPDAVLALRPLDAAECRDLIDKLTGGRLDETTRSKVAERGDGVPLYMRELAHMLDAEDDAGRDRPTVPPTLNDLLVARLDSVPAERDVVEALAVLGRPSSPELVARVAGRAADDVTQQFDVLLRAGILRTFPASPRYDFHHTLLRDAAYDVQLLAHRRELHQRSATALREAYGATRDDHAEELAHHYERAGDLDPAVELWMLAALRQASLAAHVEAIQSFDLVLGHLAKLERDLDDLDDLELRARSGRAASLLASHGYAAPEVADAYDTLRELAIARDAQLEVSSLYGLWAYYHVTGDAQASLETAEALLDLAAGCDDDGAFRAASAVLGYQLQRLGRPTEAIDLLKWGRGWDAPEPLFPHHPGIGAGANLALTQWLVGDFAAARASIAESVAAAEALDGPTAHFTRAYTHAFVAELFQVAGQPDVAARHAGRAVQVASEFGFASWLGAGMLNLKIAEGLAGDPDAIPVIEYCLTGWRAAGASSNLTQFGLGLALAYRAVGRSADALAAIDQALGDAADGEELYLAPELHRVRGELLAELRPADDAGPAALERARDTAAASGSCALELRALLSIERYAREVDGAPSEIERLLARLDPTGADPEPLLAQARAVVAREPAP